ncbi:MAG: methyltransferase domain-containing protein [Nanoarchaeota archaeon]|mgnify:CR=1 FL=1
MAKPLPQGYVNLDRLFNKITDNRKIESVLELCCAEGKYIGYLQGKGFTAEGIESDLEKIQNGNGYPLHRGELTELETIMAGRQFDVIVANNVLTVNAQMRHLSTDYPLGHLLPSSRAFHKSVNLHIEKIIQCAHNLLAPGGLLIATGAAIGPLYRIGFSQEAAESLGYNVLVYMANRAVLEKV